MKYWILFIFKMNPNLARLCSRQDAKIERVARNMFVPIHEVFDEVHELCDQKRRLVNLRVLFRHLKGNLSRAEFDLVRYREQGNLSKSTYHRRLVSAFSKCVSLLTDIGYDQKRFEIDYGGYAKKIHTKDEIRV